MKNILFVASESVPFIKTGGLADVVGSLPKSLDREKYDVRVFIPKYSCMKEAQKEKLTFKTSFYMDHNYKSIYVGIWEAEVDGIKFYFIDNEGYLTSYYPSENGIDPIDDRVCQAVPKRRCSVEQLCSER